MTCLENEIFKKKLTKGIKKLNGEIKKLNGEMLLLCFSYNSHKSVCHPSQNQLVLFNGGTTTRQQTQFYKVQYYTEQCTIHALLYLSV